MPNGSEERFPIENAVWAMNNTVELGPCETVAMDASLGPDNPIHEIDSDFTSGGSI